MQHDLNAKRSYLARYRDRGTLVSKSRQLPCPPVVSLPPQNGGFGPLYSHFDVPDTFFRNHVCQTVQLHSTVDQGLRSGNPLHDRLHFEIFLEPLLRARTAVALEQIFKIRTRRPPSSFCSPAGYIQRQVTYVSLAVTVDAAPSIPW